MLYHLTAVPKDEKIANSPIQRYTETLEFLKMVSILFPYIPFFLYQKYNENPHIVADITDAQISDIDQLEAEWPSSWGETATKLYLYQSRN